jgi:hypothetical protein
MPYSPQCQKIADELHSLQEEKQSLSSALDIGEVPGKGAAAAEIKALLSQITKTQTELNDCVKKHPYVPPPKPPADPCKSLEQQLAGLEAALAKEIRDAVAPLQQDLQHAAPGEKAGIIGQIKQAKGDILAHSPLVQQIAKAKDKLTQCITTHNGLLELKATLKGQATMTTSNGHAPGPFHEPVNIGLDFSIWDHHEVQITSFPPISVTYDTHSPAGTVTTTVSLVGGSGTFDRQSGMIQMNLSLYFHHSTSLAGDSRLDIQMSTTSALNAQGHITVDGSSHFKGGFLDQDTCWITVDGTISPKP